MTPFRLRLANSEDLPALKALMARAIRELQAPFLSPAQIEASFDYMGLDTQLVRDQTYFAVEDETGLIGCGGWSRRRTLFGADTTAGRDESLLDPATEPARVRAMYTHPDHARRGVGRAILSACEEAARAEGFSRLELMGTLSGAPLYRAAGFAVLEEVTLRSAAGVETGMLRMGKAL